MSTHQHWQQQRAAEQLRQHQDRFRQQMFDSAKRGRESLQQQILDSQRNAVRAAEAARRSGSRSTSAAELILGSVIWLVLMIGLIAVIVSQS